MLIQRRQWHPTPVLLPGKSHGQRSLVGCSPWGLGESDMTERLHFDFSLSCIGEENGSPLQWQPTPVFLPGKSQGRGSLVGCRLWGRTELDTTERFHFFHFHALEKEMATHPVFLPGESQGRGSLVGCRPWGRTESDMTEVT